MTATLRGIWFRRGRSSIVVLLAMIATAAAVVIPAYTRAAQQSVLTDTLEAVKPISAGMVASTKVGVGLGGANPIGPSNGLTGLRDGVESALAENPALAARLGPGVGATYFSGATITPGPARVQADVVYRDGVCDRVKLDSGTCPSGPGQVMVSARSAEQLGWTVGGQVAVAPDPGAGVAGVQLPSPTPYTVTGLYTPLDEQESYWGNSYYWIGLTENAEQRIMYADALFAGAESDLLGAFPGPYVGIEYPLRAGDVRLDETGAIREGLADVSRQTADLGTVSSGFPETVDGGQEQQNALSTSVPLVAVPLVLLCWFVLFLVVAALTEERGPEVALAKLRGLRMGQVTRFGLAEPLLLVLVAAPLGLLLGLGLTEFGARTFLADGVHAQLRTPVWVVAGAALAGAALAAAFATRQTVRASVLALLRRVPPRAPWRAAVVEAAVGVLALAALYQILVGGDREGPIAYLAPPLLALVAGLLAARLLNLWARNRARTAADGGAVAALLAAAQVSRRPATARMVALLAVAVGLLTFATAIWDVAGVNREIAARASTGAPLVYSVAASDPAALLAAVRKADPTGREAMAVAWSTQRYENQNVMVAGVDAPRLAAVANWPGRTAAQTEAVAALLHPATTGPIALRGPTVSVTANVRRLQLAQPARLAVVVAQGGRPRAVPLGVLATGERSYTGPLTGCEAGCRLLGLRIVRTPADFEETSIDLVVSEMRDGDTDVDLRLNDPESWRQPTVVPAGQQLQAGVTAGGLRIDARSSGSDVTVDYADNPAATPVAIAGAPPTSDPGSDTFSFIGLGVETSAMRVVDTGVALPRIGSPAVLFDMETELRQTERTGPGDPSTMLLEVWATRSAAATLPAALAANGVQVTGLLTEETRQDELGRLAPALALRLYLLAGVVAALLAVGVLLLNARVGARARRRELTALRVVGVPKRTLRAALRREYLAVLVAPLVIGAAAGLGGAALLLPAIPLVTVGDGRLDPIYQTGPYWVPGALAALVLALALAVLSVLRIVGQTDPRRLREDS